jgi:anti-sigma factor RsiW
MHCAQINSFFADLADGSLPADHEAKRHLQTCDACRAEFAQYERLIAMLRKLPRPALARDLSGAIHARLPSGHERAAWLPAPNWHLLVPAGVLAAILAAVMVAPLHSPPVDLASVQDRQHLSAGMAGHFGATPSQAEWAGVPLQDVLALLYGDPATQVAAVIWEDGRPEPLPVEAY